MLLRVIKPSCDGHHDIVRSLIIWCFPSTRKFHTKRKGFFKSHYESQPYKDVNFKQNWDEERLEPFKKNIYEIHPDALNRPRSEIEKFWKENAITISGRDCPAPIFSFKEAAFPKEINDVLRNCNFSTPTIIQSQGWPVALSGRDMIAIARTGSGKTLGFILPALAHIKNQPQNKSRNGPKALVLTPTRELAKQIHHVAEPFSRALSIRSNVVYGGQSKEKQLEILRRGHGICIGTPGRILDFLQSHEMKLNEVTHLVVDEADTMFDMGFEDQVRSIISAIRPDRQVSMWSATWPKEIRELVYDYLKDYIKINVGSVDLMPNPNITQKVHICREEEKNDLLLKILREIVMKAENKTLIFVATKRKADFVSQLLRSKGFCSEALHGDKSQDKRDRIFNAFRSSRISFLVATDVAARGLDLPDIRYVINLDFPNDIKAYIHRIGRTARYDSSGVSHTFVTNRVNEKLVNNLVHILEKCNQEVTPELRGYAGTGDCAELYM